MRPDAAYFTTWSAGWLVVALVLSRLDRHLLAAAAANSMVVGLLGPFVLAYGGVPGAPHALSCSNAWMHALPMFVAALAWPERCEAWRVLAYVAAFDLAWLAASDRGDRGWAKAKRLYGVRNPTWLLGVVALQCALCLRWRASRREAW